MFCSDLQPLVHELRITNQVMYVNPPVEDAQYQLLQELFAWEAIVTMLPRIQHSRYQVRLQICSVSFRHFKWARAMISSVELEGLVF